MKAPHYWPFPGNPTLTGEVPHNESVLRKTFSYRDVIMRTESVSCESSTTVWYTSIIILWCIIIFKAGIRFEIITDKKTYSLFLRIFKISEILEWHFWHINCNWFTEPLLINNLTNTFSIQRRDKLSLMRKARNINPRNMQVQWNLFITTT